LVEIEYAVAPREAVEDVGQPAFWVEAVQAGGFERGVDDGGAIATRVRANCSRFCVLGGASCSDT